MGDPGLLGPTGVAGRGAAAGPIFVQCAYECSGLRFYARTNDHVRCEPEALCAAVQAKLPVVIRTDPTPAAAPGGCGAPVRYHLEEEDVGRSSVAVVAVNITCPKRLDPMGLIHCRECVATYTLEARLPFVGPDGHTRHVPPQCLQADTNGTRARAAAFAQALTAALESSDLGAHDGTIVADIPFKGFDACFPVDAAWWYVSHGAAKVLTQQWKGAAGYIDLFITSQWDGWQYTVSPANAGMVVEVAPSVPAGGWPPSYQRHTNVQNFTPLYWQRLKEASLRVATLAVRAETRHDKSEL